MAKKIRFPLEMKDGVEVRDLDGLKENFSLERVLFYLADGKLETWLRDRYMDELAEAVSGLDKEDAELNRKICDIFEVEYEEEDEADIEKAMERKRKMGLLEEYTDDKQYFDVVDQIAFDQDDLYDLLDEDETVIYLCGDKFSIPLGKQGVSYIGVNNPTVVISSKEIMDFAAKGISFENVKFDGKYQNLLDEVRTKDEDKTIGNSISGSRYGDYSSRSFLNFMLSADEKAGVKSCYEKISVLMEGLMYDIDEDIRELRDKLLDSGIAGIAEEYLREL